MVEQAVATFLPSGAAAAFPADADVRRALANHDAGGALQLDGAAGEDAGGEGPGSGGGGGGGGGWRGWRAVHVYVGRASANVPAGRRYVPEAEEPDTLRGWMGQELQDLWVMRALGFPRGGWRPAVVCVCVCVRV